MNFLNKHTLSLLVIISSCGAYDMDEQPVRYEAKTKLGKALSFGVKAGAYTTIGGTTIAGANLVATAAAAITAGTLTSCVLPAAGTGHFALSAYYIGAAIVEGTKEKIDHFADSAAKFGDSFSDNN